MAKPYRFVSIVHWYTQSLFRTKIVSHVCPCFLLRFLKRFGERGQLTVLRALHMNLLDKKSVTSE